jgi:hypothetical protein
MGAASIHSALAASCLLTAGLVHGCATARVPEPPPFTQSGFLTDYSLLRPGEEGQLDFVYIDPDVDFTKYQRVLFERVAIWRESTPGDEEVETEDYQRLADDLYFAVNEKLERSRALAEHAGPGVLRVYLALTDVRNPDAPLDVFTTETPPSRLTYEALALAEPTRRFMAGISAEIEIQDSATGEILAAGVQPRIGSRRGEITDWTEVHAAFERWATWLETRLARARRGEIRAR